MAHVEVDLKNVQEQFVFSDKLKKNILTVGGIGLLLFIIGVVMLAMGGGHEHGHGAVEGAADLAATAGGGHGEGHEGFRWTTRLYANFWHNNLFFTGLAIVGVFFFAIQYAANAGWSVLLQRVMINMGAWLPISAVLMLAVFLVANHDLFHWTHSYLYDKSSPDYDPIIAGKQGFLNLPFYLSRMVVFFGVWILFANLLKNVTVKQDISGDAKDFRKLVRLSVAFLIFFGVSSSISAWDWVMSIDPHWFSTMFGWYVFASWFVSGLAAITLVTVILKEMGYLKLVNENHLHDMGKFVFAFSIFWTYIWFSQFLLIYYANIPEETVYFVDRLKSDYYSKFFFINLIMNFFFPFLVLMTRDAKRKMTMLKIVCTVVLIGHWIDFYLMITPGTLKANGGFGFLEIGLAMVYLSAFAYVIFNGLTKRGLVAQNHPMLEESIHHSC